MRYFKVVLVICALFALFVMVIVLRAGSAKSAELTDSELYPRGDLFIRYINMPNFPLEQSILASGLDTPIWLKFTAANGTYALADRSNVKLWIVPQTETGFSIRTNNGRHGPMVGSGLSLGLDRNVVVVRSLNFDLGFNLYHRGLRWNSYNLFQAGQNNYGDFSLLQQRFGLNNSGLSVVSQSIQDGHREFQSFLGPQYTSSPNNSLAIGVNLLDTRQRWVIWLVRF